MQRRGFMPGCGVKRGISRQLLQRKAVCGEEAGDKADGRGIPVFGTSGRNGQVDFGESIYYDGKSQEQRLRAGGVVSSAPQEHRRTVLSGGLQLP